MGNQDERRAYASPIAISDFFANNILYYYHKDYKDHAWCAHAHATVMESVLEVFVISYKGFKNG